ncbi:MAG: type II secretion system minor pseudopilin GspK [Gammaproteobacteria bacterium]
MPGARATTMQSGMAVLAAMLILAFAAAAAVSMASTQQIELRRMQNVAEADRARLLAADAERTAALLLADLARREKSSGGFLRGRQALPSLRTGNGQADGFVEPAQGRFNLNNLAPAGSRGDRHEDAARGGAPADPSGETGGQDQAAAAAVAAMTVDPAAATVDRRRFMRLLEILDIDPHVGAAIIDWVDADGIASGDGGAEDDHYQRADRPYRTANRPLADLGELYLVRGVTPAIVNRLAPFVVVLPGHTPIDVQTAPVEVLMCLGPGVDAATARSLAGRRERAPFASVDAFLSVPLLQGTGVTEAGLTVAGDHYRIVVHAQSGAMRIGLQSWARGTAERFAIFARRYGDVHG